VVPVIFKTKGFTVYSLLPQWSRFDVCLFEHGKQTCRLYPHVSFSKTLCSNLLLFDLEPNHLPGLHCIVHETWENSHIYYIWKRGYWGKGQWTSTANFLIVLFSWLMRNMGGFFIRRKLGGFTPQNELYRAVMNEVCIYIYRLGVC
jgi:hypothetical protein